MADASEAHVPVTCASAEAVLQPTIAGASWTSASFSSAATSRSDPLDAISLSFHYLTQRDGICPVSFFMQPDHEDPPGAAPVAVATAERIDEKMASGARRCWR